MAVATTAVRNPRPTYGAASTPMAPITPAATTSGCSHAFHVGDRPSSCNVHHAVTAIGDRQGDAGGELVAASPQHDAADPDEGADRRGEGDGVVRVDDPLTEAERGAGDDEPAAPQDQRGAGAIGAGGAPR